MNEVPVPPAWFVEIIQRLGLELTRRLNADTQSVMLHVSADTGLKLGIAPGETMSIHTAGGYVRVRAAYHPGRAPWDPAPVDAAPAPDLFEQFFGSSKRRKG